MDTFALNLVQLAWPKCQLKPLKHGKLRLLSVHFDSAIDRKAPAIREDPNCLLVFPMQLERVSVDVRSGFVFLKRP
jgi:hypothetical protein